MPVFFFYLWWRLPWVSKPGTSRVVFFLFDTENCSYWILAPNNYRPQRSCGQGYVFTRVCDSVHRGGLRRNPPGPGRNPPEPGRTPGPRRTPLDQGEPPLDQGEPPHPGPRRTPPPGTKKKPLGTKENPPRPGRTPPTRENPPDQGEPPAGTKENPPWPGRPPREEDCSILSMSGRYASYWNAFLF